jgi:hypothetical protein
MASLWPWAKRHASSEAEWSQDEEKTGQLLNEEFSKLLDVQRQAGDAVDTKAGVVVVAALTGTQFIAAQEDLYVLLLVAALAALAAAVGLAYAALRTRDFMEVPNPRTFYFKYQDSVAAEVFFNLAINKVEAFEENAKMYDQKARFWTGPCGRWWQLPCSRRQRGW